MGRTYYQWGNPPKKYCEHCKQPFWGRADYCSATCEEKEQKYELHLTFETKAERDWMAQMIRAHFMRTNEGEE